MRKTPFILVFICLLIMVNITHSDNIPRNKDVDKGEVANVKINIESKIIVGQGATVIIGTKASAKLWYDELVLLSNAKFVEEVYADVEKSQSINNDNAIEMTETIEASLLTELSISKAYPNPFNPLVNISYGLPESAAVNILIYDLSGRKIAEYSINQQSAGWHEFNWNALDQYGQTVGSGIYLITIQASDMVKKQKITFLK
jgi:hypothetical protein